MNGKVYHLASIQVLRACAASMVLLAHQWQALEQVGAPDAIPNWVAGAFGVDLFFVISGFIMVYTSEPLFGRRDASRIFIGRRLLRIVPLYWALTILFVIGWLFWFGQLPEHSSWREVLSSLLFFPTAQSPVLGQGWTLNYEMFFYCLFALAIVLRREIAVGVLTVVLFALTALPFTDPPMSVWGSSLVWEFAFGMWIGLAHRAGWRIAPALAIVVSIGAFAVALYLFNIDFAGVGRAVAWGVPAFLIVGSFALSRVDLGKPRVVAGIVALGDASYALYLVHALVPVLMRVGKVPAIIDPVQHGYLYAAISVSVSIVAAFVLNAVDRRVRHTVLAASKRNVVPSVGAKPAL